MNLKDVSDEDLRANAKIHVAQERNSTATVLHHLMEIERRRLFSAWKFESLHDYAVKELGYPADDAYRRIAAMKLLKEIPEIESKIESGELNLTNLNMARTLFRKKSYSREQKIEFLSQIENKPIRTTAKLIATISPEALMHDKVRPVSEDKAEYRFVGPQELQAKLERIKGALAHSHPSISMGELIDTLADLGLEKFAAPQKRTARQKPNSQAEVSRRMVERDLNVCTNCGSTYAHQADHVIPRAAGGRSTLTNQRQLCRSCNQRAAIEFFGVEKMEQHLDPTKREN